MTQEEKNLLLKDLYARLPYEVKGLHRGKIQRLLVMDSFGSYQVNGYAAWFNLNSVNFKPYLRPMSSMTAEEEYDYHQCKNIDYIEICEMEHTEMLKTTALCFSHAIDWLNAHHFDYRGLIEKSLAIIAPEGMYKTK